MRTYTANEIANYFLAKSDTEDGDLISNLKLQKLCYYAQGIGLVARKGQPLFNERLEAWLHGPVVPPLYGQHKSNGSGAIPAPSTLDVDRFAPEDRLILDDVYAYYSQYSAWRLREMTHEEPPWKNAYTNGSNAAITHEALIEYFSTQVTDEYRQKYEQISVGKQEG